MANKTKLELTWIGKENRPTLDLPAARQAGPRILREVPEKPTMPRPASLILRPVRQPAHLRRQSACAQRPEDVTRSCSTNVSETSDHWRSKK